MNKAFQQLSNEEILKKLANVYKNEGLYEYKNEIIAFSSWLIVNKPFYAEFISKLPGLSEFRIVKKQKSENYKNAAALFCWPINSNLHEIDDYFLSCVASILDTYKD